MKNTNLSLKQIQDVYLKIKRHLFKKYFKGDIDKTIDCIDKLAYFVQFFNWIYIDDEIEKLMRQISNDFILKKELPKSFDLKSSKRIIFYDEIGSIACLSVQYLRALIELNYDILYIFESSTRKCSNSILTELNIYSKSKIIIVDSSCTNKIDKIQELYNEIVSFDANQCLLHTPAEGAFGVILWNALNNIKRYRIVPGDHHFYLGVYCTDIFLEFRNFGCTVDVEKRNIKKNQIILNPYYPLLDNREFNGFPINVEGKIVIFSAGNYYKIYGENGLFFKMIKDIISINSNVVIMYAGDGFDKPIRQFIKTNNFEDKIFLLGYRTDFSTCIAHADIFMATFPFGGGLTTQYAAFHAKPVLSFTTNQLNNNIIDDFLGTNIKEKFTLNEYNKFIEYAKKIITDVNYRSLEGERIKRCLITENQFVFNVNKVLNNKKIIKQFDLIDINYDKRIQLYIDIENKYIARVKGIVFNHFILKGIDCGYNILLISLFSFSFYSYCWNRFKLKMISKMSFLKFFI